MTTTEKPCPGWATNRCATCDCVVCTEPPAMIAPKGAESIFPWEKPHPDDVAELERQQAQRRANHRPVDRKTVNGVTARALAALEEESRALARATEGGRNNQLNIAAFNLGQLVGMGELPERLATDVLTTACRANGLIADDGERGVEKSLNSGLNSGKGKPRAN